MEDYKDQINEEFVKSKEFDSIFENVFRGAINDFKEEKLNLFKNIFINSAIRTDVPIEEKEFFLRLLNDLSSLHIKYLFFLYNPEKFIQEKEIDSNTISSLGFGQVVEKCFSELSLDYLKVIHKDLFQMGLVNVDANIFGGLTANRGVDIIRGRISSFGERFISFCTTPK